LPASALAPAPTSRPHSATEQSSAQPATTPPVLHLPWTCLPRYAPPPSHHVACVPSPPRHRAAPTAISAAELTGRPTTTAPSHPCSARPINRPPRGPSPP
jgi:hypothetical protein